MSYCGWLQNPFCISQGTLEFSDELPVSANKQWFKTMISKWCRISCSHCILRGAPKWWFSFEGRSSSKRGGAPPTGLQFQMVSCWFPFPGAKVIFQEKSARFHVCWWVRQMLRTADAQALKFHVPPLGWTNVESSWTRLLCKLFMT